MDASFMASIDVKRLRHLGREDSAGFETDQNSEKQFSKGGPAASALGRNRNTCLPDSHRCRD